LNKVQKVFMNHYSHRRDSFVFIHVLGRFHAHKVHVNMDLTLLSIYHINFYIGSCYSVIFGTHGPTSPKSINVPLHHHRQESIITVILRIVAVQTGSEKREEPVFIH